MRHEINQLTNATESGCDCGYNYFTWFAVCASLLGMLSLAAVVWAIGQCQPWILALARAAKRHRYRDEEGEIAYVSPKESGHTNPCEYKKLEASVQHLCNVKGWRLIDPKETSFSDEMVAGLSYAAGDYFRLSEVLGTVSDEHRAMLNDLNKSQSRRQMRAFLKKHSDHLEELNALVGEIFYRISLAKGESIYSE